jgi:hypothetical protein
MVGRNPTNPLAPLWPKPERGFRSARAQESPRQNARAAITQTPSGERPAGLRTTRAERI